MLSEYILIAMYGGKNISIKVDFCFSIFLSLVALFFIIFIPEKISTFTLSGLILLISAYVIDFKILINILRKPSDLKRKREKKTSFTSIFISSFILVFLIIFNLFCLVVIIQAIDPCAFTNKPNFFDLFYFTVASFTTIGYGDIIPVTFLAKLATLIISLSSIVTLTVFLGSIFSLRNR